MMAPQKKGITTYKRDKDKMEISGDPNDVKHPILIDQLIMGLRRIIIIAIILIIVIYLVTRNNPGIDPNTLKAIQMMLPFLTLFVAVAGWALMLSG